ncbi:hypothetical protein SAMN04487981_1138 [Streptomyces sp. cf386]|uniref:hypothetical protein n=1 Tax=Streptomyces sp. cf386 TaxID=1761904 RepID=UPI000880D3C2|nr:hypothetical protein [Streptomyces sp. cf386]SDO75047.1 hypothetical protein SAMN04487981_1138 [Streptomyces sp. cf386]
MISTRRIAAAVGLAVGITGLAAPLANAHPVDTRNAGTPLNPITTLDSLATTGIPAQHQNRVPRVSQQLGHLDRINALNPAQLGHLR